MNDDKSLTLHIPSHSNDENDPMRIVLPDGTDIMEQLQLTKVTVIIKARDVTKVIMEAYVERCDVSVLPENVTVVGVKA